MPLKLHSTAFNYLQSISFLLQLNPHSAEHPLLSTQLSTEKPYGGGAVSPGHSRWEFPRERLKLGPVLGSGAFGVVMKAQAEGIKGCVGSLPVAVKIVKGL